MIMENIIADEVLEDIEEEVDEEDNAKPSNNVLQIR